MRSRHNDRALNYINKRSINKQGKEPGDRIHDTYTKAMQSPCDRARGFSDKERFKQELLPGVPSLAVVRKNWSSKIMGKAFILWLCGVPAGIIALLFFTGMLR